MKKTLLLAVLALVTSNLAVSQCNGTQSFTLTPPPVNNTYQPGQVVTMCYTMTSYPQLGSNWIEGFDLTLGAGWASVVPQTAPINCQGGGGQWIWFNSNATPIGTVGPGYFFDLNGDGVTSDDFGDFGSCTWTFCVILTVAQVCTIEDLTIAVTAGPDGLWGSWNSTTCDGVVPFTVFNGVIDPSLPSIGAISHN